MLLAFEQELDSEFLSAVESERRERLDRLSPTDVVAELREEFNRYIALNHDYVKVAAGIRANLERLKREVPAVRDRPETIAIEGAAKRLEDLPSLHQLLLRPDAAHEWDDKTRHRVLATVDSYYFYLKPMAEERGVKLARPTCRQGESSAMVYGSRRVLGGIVLQLIDNAISYSESGEVVSLAVDELPDGEHVAIVCESVGPKILPTEQVTIFKPFYRGEAARAVRDGGGVGLAIVKVAVEVLGGSVSVEQEGNGDRRKTTFRVTLPRAG